MHEFMIPLVIMFLIACIGHIRNIIIHLNDNKNGKK